MNNVVTTEDLQKVACLSRKSDIEKYLQAQNIRYFTSKNGPWTTIGLIEAAKGLVNGNDLGSSNDEELL